MIVTVRAFASMLFSTGSAIAFSGLVAAARTQTVLGGQFWPSRGELSRHIKCMARARIPEFESSHASQAVGSLWAVRARPSAYWLAKNVDDLHSDSVNITKQTALTEKGEGVSGRGDAVNMHDILTGSNPSGRFSTAGGDTTCGNWTKSGDGSSIVGHHDRVGLKDTWHMRSWNSSHGSRGCSQEQLKASGGAGLLYCFALTETT